MDESPRHSVLQDDVELDKIFHVLDEDGAGHITVDKFTTALNSFIPDEISQDKLRSLLDHLDPQSDGRIYLNDFKKAISRLQYSTDSLRVSQQGSTGDAATPTAADDESTGPPSAGAAAASGANGAWPALDGASAAAAVDELDSAILQHDSSEPGHHRQLSSSSAHWQTAAAAGAAANCAEESFEDWGSVELGTGCLIDFGSTPSETSANGGGGALKPPLPPDAQAQLERGTEVRGTWPRHRPRPDNIKLNVPSRSPSLRSPHPSRRPSRTGTGALFNGLHRPPSANQLAQQLYSTSSGRSSPRTSGDGMFYDEADFPDAAGLYNDEMKDQLKLLSEKVEELKNGQSLSDSRYNKLIEENQLLRERLSRQEDDYRDAESRLRRKIDDDKSRAKAKLAKVNREKEAEIERLIEKSRECEDLYCRLRQTETSLNEHRVEAARHRAEAERLRAENARLEERSEALDSRLTAARDDVERHREAGRRELDTAKRERDQAQALLEELNRELDSWRSGGAATSGGGRERTASAAEMLSRYREVEQLAKRLTHENKGLREQLEEAQAELLTRGLEEGKALLSRHGAGASTSLAAELETMTKDELMDLLVREKDANDKLRSYIDRILLRIMEQQPDLLEVGLLA